MRKTAAFVLALLLALCAGCGAGGGTWEVCRTAAEHYRAGGAELLGFESVTVEEGENAADALIAALNSPPDDPELQNPLPEDARILGCNLSGGVLELRAAEGYARLSGLDKTLCDCCLALTLCRLDGVDAIRVNSGGETVTEELSPDDILILDAASAPENG